MTRPPPPRCDQAQARLVQHDGQTFVRLRLKHWQDELGAFDLDLEAAAQLVESVGAAFRQEHAQD